MVSKLKLLLLLAISIGLFGCTSDQASGGFHDALFFATGIVSEVNIDGGTKTVAVIVEADDSGELAIGEQALFDFSDFDVSWRVPRDDLDGIYPGDKVDVDFFLTGTKGRGYDGYEITKLLE